MSLLIRILYPAGYSRGKPRGIKPYRLRLIKTKLSDCNNPWYNVKCGNSTFGRIFLLSYDEVVRDGNFTRAAESSMYTKKPHGDAIFDQYNDAWKVLNLKGDEDWWCTKKPLL